MSGTSGFTSPQSHKDMLLVLQGNDSLLPNEAGACLISPHKQLYYVIYTKHSSANDGHSIAITTYAPPKPGRTLLIYGNAVGMWPVISGFAYDKKTSTLTLKVLNEIGKEMGLLQVAVGPIKYEKKSYRSLCNAFMSVNSMSFIAWPVGQHNDHFNDDDESLESMMPHSLLSPCLQG